MIFLGQHTRMIDEKGRLVIPSEFRQGLAGGAVMTRSFDTCLCIYPIDEWEAAAGAVRDLPQIRPQVRDLARSIFGGATHCALDAQGRVTVPAYLREFADLRADAVVVGVNGHLEIWSQAAWQQKQRVTDGSERVFLEALTASGA